MWESEFLYDQGACGFLKVEKYCDREKWCHLVISPALLLWKNHALVEKEVRKAKKLTILECSIPVKAL